MDQFQKWLVVSGSHYQNGKSYRKGDKFVTDADMNAFNTLPHAPKYKSLGAATEAEITLFQAQSGFAGHVPAPPHVEMEEAPGPGFLNKPKAELKSQPESQVDAEQKADIEDEGEEVEDSLEAMTISELKSLAADENINLHGITHKGDIVEKIREARAE